MTPERLQLVVEAALAAVCLAVAFAAGWFVQGWRLDTKIAQVQAGRANDKATQAEGALTALKADAAAIHDAATEYSAARLDVGAKIDALRKELKNAPRPLAPGCAPDAYRVRNLETAIDAANAAAARH